MAIALAPASRSGMTRIASGGSSSGVFAPLEIAQDRCKGCGLCVTVCPKQVLALNESTVNTLGYHPVRLLAAGPCTSCALCARICPDAVFSVYAPAKVARR